MQGQENHSLKNFVEHLKYIAQDFGEYQGAGEVGLQTGTWDNSKLDIVSDILSIPLPDHSVDAIMCTEVLEHIPDPLGAIKEFNRLIKPGGYLLVHCSICEHHSFCPISFRFRPEQIFL
jgi:ubiquinone/menaquinone biosynthesis C-methylase UbiE